jgi:Fis family transcriptional regulator
LGVKVQLENLVLHMYKDGIPYSEAVREFQKGFVLTVLQQQKGNQLKAAQDLGMHRNTLRRIIHALQIDIQPIRSAARRRPPSAIALYPRKTKERAM